MCFYMLLLGQSSILFIYLFIYFVDAEFTIKPSIGGYLKSIVEKSLFAHCSMNTFILAYNYITLSIQSNASK